MPSLFVIRGNDQGVRFELVDETIGLGRDATNYVQLHDTEVSRRHAEIRRQGKSLLLTDLGSSNGTFINGHRVERHELASGDQIQVGSTLLLFTASDEDVQGSRADRVEIVAPHAPDEGSRIVRSIRQEEGSQMFRSSAVEQRREGEDQAASNLQVVYRTALAISHTLDIDQLLTRIMQLIFEWVEADRGCIMLLDPDTKRLVPKVRRDRRANHADERLAISQTILDYVLGHNEGVRTTNAREDERWDPAKSIVQLGIREALCVPMRGRYDMVGVIYLDTSTPSEKVLIEGRNRANRFSDDHLKLLIAIAHQAALAVEDTRYYSAMVQAERLAAVGQTIATLSHHIKNILQGIRGGSYLIEMGLSDAKNDVIRKGWDIVEKNQKKISTLVMDMLTFSKEREPDLQPANLNEVTADVVELMQSRADEMQVRLEYRPFPHLPEMTFDPEGLHRAILNIVTNAIDACDTVPENRVATVVVSTAFDPAEQVVRVIVEDNGSGIAPEDREQIFALFVSRKGGRGTGLGLSVSNKIIREHGGRIVVESEPDQGSRFTLELPAILVDEPQSGTTILPKQT